MLDFERVNFIDSHGTEAIGRLLDAVALDDVGIRLARVKPPVLAMLDRDGIIDRVGRNNIHAKFYEAGADLIPE